MLVCMYMSKSAYVYMKYCSYTHTRKHTSICECMCFTHMLYSVCIFFGIPVYHVGVLSAHINLTKENDIP